VLRIQTEFAGLPMTLDACREDCDRPVAVPLDLGALLATPSPYPIPRRLAHAKLRYVLVRADGQAPALVRTGEQHVVMDGGRAVVTICATCGTADDETPESLAPYLRANAWVRSDAPEIRRLAGRIDTQPGRPLDSRMKRLGRAVSSRISGAADYLGYADAVQALRSGRGDCTEYAVLLAALARAQGIPARIAVGMAYSNRFAGREDAFNPHVWVQVHDGTRWVSYDPALDGFDSTHVALAVGTGEPQEVFDAFLQLRRLRIERLGAVVR
jgi:transglutaminase-like putative cysteine protease